MSRESRLYRPPTHAAKPQRRGLLPHWPVWLVSCLLILAAGAGLAAYRVELNAHHDMARLSQAQAEATAAEAAQAHIPKVSADNTGASSAAASTSGSAAKTSTTTTTPSTAGSTSTKAAAGSSQAANNASAATPTCPAAQKSTIIQVYNQAVSAEQVLHQQTVRAIENNSLLMQLLNSGVLEGRLDSETARHTGVLQRLAHTRDQQLQAIGCQ